MVVYPEMESWNEFYPSEIFMLLSATDDHFPVFKKAKIGTTIYLADMEDGAFVSSVTTVIKKIGVIEDPTDISSSMILVGYISNTVG